MVEGLFVLQNVNDLSHLLPVTDHFIPLQMWLPLIFALLTLLHLQFFVPYGLRRACKGQDFYLLVCYKNLCFSFALLCLLVLFSAIPTRKIRQVPFNPDVSSYLGPGDILSIVLKCVLELVRLLCRRLLFFLVKILVLAVEERNCFPIQKLLRRQQLSSYHPCSYNFERFWNWHFWPVVPIPWTWRFTGWLSIWIPIALCYGRFTNCLLTFLVSCAR